MPFSSRGKALGLLRSFTLSQEPLDQFLGELLLQDNAVLIAHNF